MGGYYTSPKRASLTGDLLVTGATGFIGSHLSKRLVQEGYSVVGLSRTGRPEKIRPLLERKEFSLAVGDVRDAVFLNALMKEKHIAAIFHLAATILDSRDDQNSPEYIGTNLQGTLNMLQAADINGVRRVIYASSLAVYSVPPEHLPVRESDPLRPPTIYGISKVAGEYCCHLFSGRMNISVLRFGGVYGSGERRSSVTCRFIEQARANRPIGLYGNGVQSTDFVYVDDVVDACLSALHKDNPGVYNVSSGEETTVVELARRIVCLTNSKSEIVQTGDRSDRPFRFVLDITKARRELELTPVSLDQGLLAYLKQFNERLDK